MADILVDTDVFIDHLRGARQLAPGRHRVHYSVITRAELFAGNTASQLVSTLLAPFREVPAIAQWRNVPAASVERAASGSQTPPLRQPRSNTSLA